jgi:hypothetical protein
MIHDIKIESISADTTKMFYLPFDLSLKRLLPEVLRAGEGFDD